MTEKSPLWPAALHHLRYDSPALDAMVRFYRDGLGLAAEQLPDGTWLLSGRQRRLVLAPAETADQPWGAFAFPNEGRLDEFRAWVQRKGVNVQPNPSPLFGEGAFRIDDPDGRGLVFGAPVAPDGGETDAMPGRLQHYVVATTQLAKLTEYYRDTLGFVVSDIVREGDEPTAVFFRSDPEHHSFATFRAPEGRPDHHSYEATSWDDIRDWADHFAAMEVDIFWGPGRHGPGNNLFIMVEDPDGNKVEISAEIERMHRHMPHREWAHEERTLNLWGKAWMRS